MEENVQGLKKGFFKKVWYSILKLEKYGEMSAEGLKQAIKYAIQISLIIAIVLSFGTIYQINEKVKKGVNFIENEVGDFTYKDGILNVESNEPIIAPSATAGKIIIDTNIESEEDINQYLNSIEENMGILLLKDKVIIKGLSKGESITYKYNTLLNNLNISEIDNEGTIKYINENKWNIYIQIFIIICIYTLISTFISIIVNAILLSIFGWVATWFARIKMRYVAIFNLAIYSLTLSTLLQAAYVIVNALTGFNITYFQVMYVAVAAIYLIASIFLIKSEFIKTQAEEIKKMESIINEVKEKEEEKENQDKKQEEPEEEPEQETKEKANNDTENEEGKDKDKENKKDKDNDKDDEDPEGSQA